MRPRLLATLLALSVALAPASAWAVAPRASLTDIENDVMCVTCREPLIEAQSPQAAEERGFIRQLIAQGQDKRQIEQALVAQYGPSVLGKPPASGFDLTVYLLPAAAVVLALAATAIVLPPWRRATRAQEAGHPRASGPTLTAAEAQRLEADLQAFDV